MSLTLQVRSLRVQPEGMEDGGEAEYDVNVVVVEDGDGDVLRVLIIFQAVVVEWMEVDSCHG